MAYIYLIVNELPYAKRMSSEDMSFAGLWFSKKKTAKGLEINSPEREKFLCKGIVLACMCDLPARCLMCNSIIYILFKTI